MVKQYVRIFYELRGTFRAPQGREKVLAMSKMSARIVC